MIRVIKPDAPKILRTKGPPALQKLCDAFDAGLPLEFDAKIYAAAEVKKSLIKAQHEKCAFCESFFTHIAFGDVEHFRPKAAYRQSASGKLTQPGYYWLAYEWSNLLCSCTLCNQHFKRNLFPLKNPRRRALTRIHPLDDERPLIVDPSVRNPEQFITFDKATAVPVDGSREGLSTIKVLGLNRDKLIEARLRSIDNLKALLGWRDAIGVYSPEDQEKIDKVLELIHLKTRLESEHAAMIRSFLRQGAESRVGG